MILKNTVVRVTDSDVTIFNGISSIRLLLSLSDLREGTFYEGATISIKNDSISLRDIGNIYSVARTTRPYPISIVGSGLSLELSEITFRKLRNWFGLCKPEYSAYIDGLYVLKDSSDARNSTKVSIPLNNRAIYYKDLL